MEKRRDNWKTAVEVWQLAADGNQVYAHVELAKFYEHKQRNYDTALYWTETALKLLSQADASHTERRQWLGELKHRQARLRRKAAKTK